MCRLRRLIAFEAAQMRHRSENLRAENFLKKSGAKKTRNRNLSPESRRMSKPKGDLQSQKKFESPGLALWTEHCGRPCALQLMRREFAELNSVTRATEYAAGPVNSVRLPPRQAWESRSLPSRASMMPCTWLLIGTSVGRCSLGWAHVTEGADWLPIPAGTGNTQSRRLRRSPRVG